MPSDEDRQRQLGSYYAMAQVGIEMVVPVCLGWWADERLGSGPWLLIVGAILGFFLGLWHLVVLSRGDAVPKNKSQRDKEP